MLGGSVEEDLGGLGWEALRGPVKGNWGGPGAGGGAGGCTLQPAAPLDSILPPPPRHTAHPSSTSTCKQHRQRQLTAGVPQAAAPPEPPDGCPVARGGAARGPWLSRGVRGSATRHAPACPPGPCRGSGRARGVCGGLPGVRGTREAVRRVGWASKNQRFCNYFRFYSLRHSAVTIPPALLRCGAVTRQPRVPSLLQCQVTELCPCSPAPSHCQPGAGHTAALRQQRDHRASICPIATCPARHTWHGVTGAPRETSWCFQGGGFGGAAAGPSLESPE